MFKLDDGVEIPVRLTGPGSIHKYPFKEMSVGQSFFVPLEDGDTAKVVMQRLSPMGRRYFGKGGMALRKVTENGKLGVRVWRLK